MASSNLYNGMWSNQYSRKFILGSLFIVLIFAISIGLMEAVLPCVDSKGCLKDHCDLTMLNADYQVMIRKSHNDNDKCRAHPNIPKIQL